MTAVSPWWPGFGSDHIVESCPHLARHRATNARGGLPAVGKGTVDPDGTDICGWCLRVWRAQRARAA